MINPFEQFKLMIERAEELPKVGVLRSHAFASASGYAESKQEELEFLQQLGYANLNVWNYKAFSQRVLQLEAVINLAKEQELLE